MRRTGPTNVVLRKLIRRLKKAANQNKAPVWDYVAEILSRPSRARPSVNISKINRYSNDGEIVVVPGKVLASGEITKSLTVAAVSFSSKALEKILRAGGKAISIDELLDENPEGRGVKVIV